MKPNTISLRRRQLVIAGLAAAATPGALFAAQCKVGATGGEPQLTEVFTEGTDEMLVISGRVVGSDCTALSGARVEVWYADPKTAATTTTDADGRFLLTASIPSHGDSRAFNIAVTRPDGRTLTARRHVTREPGVSGEALAQVQRDESGVWRTTLGLTFA